MQPIHRDLTVFRQGSGTVRLKASAYPARNQGSQARARLEDGKPLDINCSAASKHRYPLRTPVVYISPLLNMDNGKLRNLYSALHTNTVVLMHMKTCTSASSHQ